MPVWTIIWALVFVTPSGGHGGIAFEQDVPKFESEEECMAYLGVMMPFIESRFGRDYEWPSGTQYSARATCKSSRPA